MSDAALKRQVARRFAQAAAGYDDGARLQRHAGRVLLAHFDRLPAADSLLDLGCGSGWLTAQLATRCGALVAVDLAPAMAAATARRCAQPVVVADAERLPLASATFARVVSNLMIQWLDPALPALAEMARVLEPGGVALVHTLLPGTLRELGAAFAAVDGQPRINAFMAADALVAAAWQAGFSQVRLHQTALDLPYPSARVLCRELKRVGANTLVAGHRPLSVAQWRAVEAHFGAAGAADGVAVRWQLGLLELQR